MGTSSTASNVTACLAALEQVLAAQGQKVEAGAAVKAAEQALPV
jgi:aspartate aminotransferase-like enzyme